MIRNNVMNQLIIITRHLGIALAALVVVLLIPTFIIAQSIPPVPHPLAGRDDCLGCHQGVDADTPPIPRDHLRQTNDTCQDCHQLALSPDQPLPTPLVSSPSPENLNNCRECHAGLAGQQADLVTHWEGSIHARRKVSCIDCHGGDPTANSKEAAKSSQANYVGVPAKIDIPALCAGCHSDTDRMQPYNLPTDQYARYQESIHGFLLSKGDQNVATCSDCHGSHQVLAANDPASTVSPLNVPGMCARCHADEALMADYDIPTNQYDLYRESVHGQALLDNQDLQAPTCATCHGTHGAAPAGFEEATDICASCHVQAQENYLQSPHANAGRTAPSCVTCHGRYDVGKASEALYQGTQAGHCGACHPPDSEPGQIAQTLYGQLIDATRLYGEAEAAVQTVQRAGMSDEALEAQLNEAYIGLINARVVQHTLDVPTLSQRTDEIQTIAGEVKAKAEAVLTDGLFNYLGLAVALLAVALATGALFMLKRELDRL